MRLPVVAAAALALLLGPTVRASPHSADALLLDEINGVRVTHGLAPLHPDARLARAADAHTRLMIRTGTFAHGAFAARMREFHVGGRLVGENLAWGVGLRATAAALVEAWMRSPGHRANLLRPSFRRVGVSAVTTTFAGYAGATVVTADFAC